MDATHLLQNALDEEDPELAAAAIAQGADVNALRPSPIGPIGSTRFYSSAICLSFHLIKKEVYHTRSALVLYTPVRDGRPRRPCVVPAGNKGPQGPDPELRAYGT